MDDALRKHQHQGERYGGKKDLKRDRKEDEGATNGPQGVTGCKTVVHQR